MLCISCQPCKFKDIFARQKYRWATVKASYDSYFASNGINMLIFKLASVRWAHILIRVQVHHSETSMGALFEIQPVRLGQYGPSLCSSASPTLPLVNIPCQPSQCDWCWKRHLRANHTSHRNLSATKGLLDHKVTDPSWQFELTLSLVTKFEVSGSTDHQCSHMETLVDRSP